MIYKYQLNLYKIYKANYKIWYSSEIKNIMHPLGVKDLYRKNLINVVPFSRANKILDDAKDNRRYWEFTEKGLGLIKFLDKHPNLTARMLLEK